MRGKKASLARSCKPSTPTLVALAATLVAVVWSFPVVLDPTRLLWGVPGDSLSTLLRWEKWQLSVRYVDRPLLNLLGRLLALPLGPVFAYNLLTLLSFPLSALTAYALFRRLVGSPHAAACGALLFALSPYHYAHSLGHLYEAHIEWIPLVALTLYGLATRPGPPISVATAFVGALLVSSSFYYGFFLAVVASPLVCAWLVWLLVRREVRRALLVAASLLLPLLVTLPVTYPYVRWLSREPTPPATLQEDLFRYSARAREYLVPGAFSALRRLLSPTTRPGSLHYSNEVEQSLFLGWIPLALACVGAVCLLRRSPPRGSRELGWLMAAGVVAAVCSAPPVVRVGGVPIPMPSGALAGVVPFFRTYARMGVIVSLATSGTYAAGLAWGVRRPGAMTALTLLALLEFWPVPPPRSVRILPLRGATAWLARHDPNPVILEYPMDTRATPRLSVRGYLGARSGVFSLEEIIPFDVRHPGAFDEDRARELAAHGVGWVALHDRNPDPALQVYKDRPERGHNLPGGWPVVDGPFSLTAHFPQTLLFRITAARQPLSLAPGEGIGSWVEGPSLVGRPLTPRARVVIHSVSRWPRAALLEAVVVPGGRVRAIRLVLNGVEVGTWTAADTVWVSAGGLEVLPDENTVWLESLDHRGEILEGSEAVGRLLAVRLRDLGRVGQCPETVPLDVGGGERGIRTLGAPCGGSRDFQSRRFNQLSHLSEWSRTLAHYTRRPTTRNSACRSPARDS